MARGGYQRPRKPAPVSGPGRFAQRTDGRIAEPDIDRERGLEYGDRQRLTEAQRIAKSAVGQGASVGQPAPRLTGQARREGGLPPWLFDMPSARPEEPITSGLEIGPGPGPEALEARAPAPDVRELVLENLWLVFGNTDAARMLRQLREERAQQLNQEGSLGGIELPGGGVLQPPSGGGPTGAVT